jgi:hypothetical protein
MIRRGAALAALICLIPAPAFAHAVGPGSGVEIELLLAAGALLVAGFGVRSDPKRFVIGNVLVTLGAVGIAAALVIPNLSSSKPSSTSARIAILSPKDGANVDAGSLEVEVDLKNGSLATDASDTTSGHIHIYIDGELSQMPFKTTSIIQIKPGTHDITAEYVDAQHLGFDPPVTATITVEAS